MAACFALSSAPCSPLRSPRSAPRRRRPPSARMRRSSVGSGRGSTSTTGPSTRRPSERRSAWPHAGEDGLGRDGELRRVRRRRRARSARPARRRAARARNPRRRLVPARARQAGARHASCAGDALVPHASRRGLRRGRLNIESTRLRNVGAPLAARRRAHAGASRGGRRHSARDRPVQPARARATPVDVAAVSLGGARGERGRVRADGLHGRCVHGLRRDVRVRDACAPTSARPHRSPDVQIHVAGRSRGPARARGARGLRRCGRGRRRRRSASACTTG